MTGRRIMAFFMVALQAIVVARLFGHQWFAAAMVAAAFAGLWGRVQLDLGRTGKLVFAAALGVVILSDWRFLLPESPDMALVFMGRVGHAVVKYLLALQAAQLFIRHPSGLPALMGLYGAAFMTCAGDMVMRGGTRLLYQTCAVGFVGLAAGFYAFCPARAYVVPVRRRSHYRAATWGLIAVALSLSVGLAATLTRYRDALDSALLGMLLGKFTEQSAGIETAPKLGDLAELKGKDENLTALCVESAEQPGYLRAKAYDRYANGRWQASLEKRDLEPKREDPDAERKPVGYEYYYVWDEGDDADWTPMDIWSNMFDRSCLFRRLRSTATRIPCSQLGIDDSGNVTFEKQRDTEIYRVYTHKHGEPTPKAALSPKLRSRYTQTPNKLDPRVRALAERIFRGRDTTLAKVMAVVNYFYGNYTYHLGIRVPKGQDALTYFLLDKPPAHCEYFATGAAVLLRLGGVPCRYVTGFVVSEKNPFGGFWMARNKDAHAWVEAYDEQRGWFIVEPTVSDGLPTSNERGASLRSYLWDYLRFSNERRKDAFIKTGVKGVMRQMGRSAGAFLRRLLSPLPVAIAGFCLAAYGAVALLQWRRRVQPAAASPEVTALQALLKQMDRRMRTRGLARGDQETLHQFAARITRDHAGDEGVRDAAQWYVEYASARYGRPSDEGGLAALRHGVEGRA